VPDPRLETWAVILLDDQTLAALPHLLPATEDRLLRTSAWISVQSAFQLTRLDPEVVLALVEAAIPHEDTDDGVSSVLGWTMSEVVPVAVDREAARGRVHRAAAARARTAPPGSGLQLAGFWSQVATSDDAEDLREWLVSGDRLPDGVVIDLDLRWRILRRLAALGATDRDELAAALGQETTAVSQVEHVRAVASLPDPEAKAWAWRRFTGEVEVPNYELEAAGLGLWQLGQEQLTADYVGRYFDDLPATAHIRSGFLLGLATGYFYPRWAVAEDTLARAQEVLATDVDSTIRRALVDETWGLERRVAVRRRFAR
jgi:aminopeptidase N